MKAGWSRGDIRQCMCPRGSPARKTTSFAFLSPRHQVSSEVERGGDAMTLLPITGKIRFFAGPLPGFFEYSRDSCACSRPLSRICEDGRPRRRSGTLQYRPIACPGSWEIRRPTTPSITSFPAPRNRSKPSLSSKGSSFSC